MRIVRDRSGTAVAARFCTAAAAAVVWLLAGAAAAGAQEAEPGAELTVYHAIYGPGDRVWEHYGHNAIWIHDAFTGSTLSYNYGFFRFDQPGFIPRLMRGDMLYEMGVRTADEEIATYSYYDREIVIQRLDLTPAERHALREFLEWNWLPQNKDYLYDYFRDNCSTRVRDALDRVLGGALARALQGVPTGETYRSHSLRLTAASLPTAAGLLLGLGMPTDREIDAWEEGFVPMELGRHLASVSIERNGVAVPLVAEERVLYRSGRAPPPAEPPNRTPGFLFAGMLLGGGLVGLGRAARRGRRSALALAMTLATWGAVVGFFGVILTLLWTATNHIDSASNLNLLHVNPIALILAAAAPLLVLRRTTGRSHRIARLAWPAAVTLAVLSAGGVLLQLMPGVHQVNGPIAALALPIHIGAVLALYQAIPGGSSSREDSEAAISLSAAA